MILICMVLIYLFFSLGVFTLCVGTEKAAISIIVPSCHTSYTQYRYLLRF